MKAVGLSLLFLLSPAVKAAGAEASLSPEALGRIDAHAHVFVEAPPVFRLLERLNVTAVNICVVDRYEPGYETLAPQHRMARRVAKASRGHLSWIATFDDSGFARPDFARRVIADLGQALGQGALGVKIYKSMGMELRSGDGGYVLPDDPIFEPIFAALAARGTTVYAHLAEPLAAWQPLDPTSPDYDYYKKTPAWHVAGRAGVPSKAAILAARDRLLEKHPRLMVVGCHLGSMEEDVDEIATRLDRYPNFAVDTAARIVHLMQQPQEKVRAFLIRYQDRVLYGTDLGLTPGLDVADAARRFEAEYARDWAYFATDRTIEHEGRTVKGLALPEPVLRRLFRENALRWVSGLRAAPSRVMKNARTLPATRERGQGWCFSSPI
jgi:predicted TIM-barrel fold metal-dependent hydrolase